MLRRPRHSIQPILSLGNVALDTASLALHVGGLPVEMPRRELTVMHELLRNQGRLVPRRKLEESVYPFDKEVTPNAIEAAVSRLRRRLETHNASCVVTSMRGLGYILSERPE